jgi:hypothetical protein
LDAQLLSSEIHLFLVNTCACMKTLTNQVFPNVGIISHILGQFLLCSHHRIHKQNGYLHILHKYTCTFYKYQHDNKTQCITLVSNELVPCSLVLVSYPHSDILTVTTSKVHYCFNTRNRQNYYSSLLTCNDLPWTNVLRYLTDKSLAVQTSL